MKWQFINRKHIKYTIPSRLSNYFVEDTVNKKGMFFALQQTEGGYILGFVHGRDYSQGIYKTK